MGNKLSATNRYLRDPRIREEGLWISAKSSSAVEGIRKPFATKRSKVKRPSRGGARSG